jgi:hypothetical protein
VEEVVTKVVEVVWQVDILLLHDSKLPLNLNIELLRLLLLLWPRNPLSKVLE